MSDLQLLVAHAVKLALLALLAGIVLARAGEAVLGRSRSTCWRSSLGNILVTLWPARFFTPSFWVLKQGVYDALKMAVALELAWRAFDAFPGACAHGAGRAPGPARR